MTSAWIKISDELSIGGEEFENNVENINRLIKTDKEIYERFLLMSKFYSKSLLYSPCEEKFILLWTALEIFPMKDTSNIRPIISYLSKVVSQPDNVVKEKLGIGKMYGIRSKLVHDGIFEVETASIGEFFTKLELVVETIMSDMVELPYTGRLNKYWTK